MSNAPLGLRPGMDVFGITGRQIGVVRGIDSAGPTGDRTLQGVMDERSRTGRFTVDRRKLLGPYAGDAVVAFDDILEVSPERGVTLSEAATIRLTSGAGARPAQRKKRRFSLLRPRTWLP